MVADFAVRRDLQVVKAEHGEVGQPVVHDAGAEAERPHCPLVVLRGVVPQLIPRIEVGDHIGDRLAHGIHPQMDVHAGGQDHIADLDVARVIAEQIAAPQRAALAREADERLIAVEAVVGLAAHLGRVAAEQRPRLRLDVHHIHLKRIVGQIGNARILGEQQKRLIVHLQVAEPGQRELAVHDLPLPAILREIGQRGHIRKVVLIVNIVGGKGRKRQRADEQRRAKNKTANFFHSEPPPALPVCPIYYKTAVQ